MKPLWRDYSKHQGITNHDVAKRNGVQGMFARSTISWGYQDSWFNYNYDEAKRVGYYRSSYHVIYPSEPIVKQTDNWYKMHPELDIIPRAIDAELQHSSSDKQVGDAIWAQSELVLSRDGVHPWIYGSALQLGRWLAHWDDDMINAHYFWLAQYLYKWIRKEHPGPPDLIDGLNINRVVFHQTSGYLPGFPGEAESGAVDINRFQLGDAIDQENWIRENYGDSIADTPPTEPAPTQTTNETLDELQEDINQLIEAKKN